MADAYALARSPSQVYRPRQRNGLQRLFQDRFGAFTESWRKHAITEGAERRLRTIERAAAAFDACADWERGVARIRCPDCGHDLFRPFSCKSYFLCPSCAQKRSLLLGEYIAEDLLLRLPHRQFVFTIPKALRGFLRRDRRLFGRLG